MSYRGNSKFATVRSHKYRPGRFRSSHLKPLTYSYVEYSPCGTQPQYDTNVPLTAMETGEGPPRSFLETMAIGIFANTTTSHKIGNSYGQLQPKYIGTNSRAHGSPAVEIRTDFAIASRFRWNSQSCYYPNSNWHYKTSNFQVMSIADFLILLNVAHI